MLLKTWLPRVDLSRMTVLMAGGIERFVSLLKDGSLEAQEYALWLLWQSTDVASKKSIATAGCADSNHQDSSLRVFEQRCRGACVSSTRRDDLR